jgi:nucleoid-associated protein YgaU
MRPHQKRGPHRRAPSSGAPLIGAAQITRSPIQPSRSPTPAAAEATPTPPPVVCAQEYIVQADDWLSKLSEKFLGDVMRFPSIAEATNEMHATDDTFARISNPNLIEVGWKLCIP